MTNKNPEAIPVTISDTIVGGPACTVSDTTVTVPAAHVDGNGTKEVTYSCDVTSLDPGNNVATVSWDIDRFSGQNDSGNVPFSFDGPTDRIDNCIDVSDAFNGADPAALGEVCLKDLDENGSYSCEYPRVLDGTPGECVSFPNKASFITNDTGATGDDSTSVEVCEGKDLDVSKTADGTFDWRVLLEHRQGRQQDHDRTSPSAARLPSTTPSRWISDWRPGQQLDGLGHDHDWQYQRMGGVRPSPA